MGSNLSEYKGTGTATGSHKRELLIAIVLVALPVLAVAAMLIVNSRKDATNVETTMTAIDPADVKFFNEPARIKVIPATTGSAAVDPADLKFFSALVPDRQVLSAGELAALRWQAMARFYEKNDLLLHDSGTPIEPEDAYYTEQYWKMAAESQPVEEPVPDYELRRMRGR